MPITSTFAAGVETDFPQSQAYANFRNLLDGGDFTTNPMQRNVAGYASNNAMVTPGNNTTVYFADRWFGYAGANSALQMSLVAQNSVAGFNSALTFGRNNTNNNTTVLYFGQVLETAKSIAAQGQPVTFSFWASLGANFTGAGSNVTVQVIAGTGNNQTANNMCANNWTGPTYLVNQAQSMNNVATRYTFTGTVPANATQLGVALSYTPNNNNATATDYVQVSGLQLEVGATASQFEHRDSQVETSLCQRYAWVIAEPANNIAVAAGSSGPANNQVFVVSTPTQMRSAPTVTVSAGNFKVLVAGTATAGVAANGTGHTPNALTLAANAVQTTGQGSLLVGGGNNGYVIASSEF